MDKKTFTFWVIVLCAILFMCIFMTRCAYAEVRPWTPDEKVFLIWGAGAAAFDIYTTNKFLQNDDNWEVNPILGRHPDPLAVVTYIVSEYLVAVTIAHFWPDLKLPLIGKVNMRHQILYNRASRYTANSCWNTRLEW